MKLLVTTLAILMAFLFATGSNAQIVTIQDGKCVGKSLIAEGLATEDLTKRQSRYFCDSLVMTSYDNRPPKVMFQFAEKGAHHGSPLGFVGYLTDKDIFTVDHIYLEPGVQTKVDNGFCKLFRQGKRIGSLMCGATVLEGERKTVAVVEFTVARK